MPGEITLQCLEGNVVFTSGESERQLASGDLMYLNGSDEHSLHAIVDSSLLLTIVLKPKTS